VTIYLINEVTIYLTNEVIIYLTDEVTTYLVGEVTIYLTNEVTTYLVDDKVESRVFMNYFLCLSLRYENAGKELKSSIKSLLSTDQDEMDIDGKSE
jgi:hypothetical protein